MNLYLIAGLLLHSSLIVINRFVKRLPNWLQIPLLLIGIGLLILGLIQSR